MGVLKSVVKNQLHGTIDVFLGHQSARYAIQSVCKPQKSARHCFNPK